MLNARSVRSSRNWRNLIGERSPAYLFARCNAAPNAFIHLLYIRLAIVESRCSTTTSTRTLEPRYTPRRTTTVATVTKERWLEFAQPSKNSVERAGRPLKGWREMGVQKEQKKYIYIHESVRPRAQHAPTSHQLIKRIRFDEVPENNGRIGA